MPQFPLPSPPPPSPPLLLSLPCPPPSRLHTLSRPPLPLPTLLRGFFVTDVFATDESNNATTVCSEFSPNAPTTPFVYGTLGGRPMRLLAGAPLVIDGITMSVIKQGNAEVFTLPTPGWAITATTGPIKRFVTPGKTQVDLSLSLLCIPLALQTATC